VIDDAGHLMHYDTPVALADELRAWLSDPHHELNDRPRKRLGFYKPTEQIAELLLR